MPIPTVKRHDKKVPVTNTAALISSDVCPICPHLMSAHDEAKGRQCSLCACVPQDVAAL